MRRIFYVMIFFLALAGGTPSLAKDAAAEKGKGGPVKKVLIVYYSYSGNTKQIAEYIKESTGGDLFEIVPDSPYPSDYHEVTEQAKKEINSGIKPGIKDGPPGFADYDVVFIGSPCWWSTIAPPVASFLSAHDFAGKTVVPFMTHEGSGLGRSVKDISAMTPYADIDAGRAFRGNSVSSAKGDVFEWVKQLKLEE